MLLIKLNIKMRFALWGGNIKARFALVFKHLDALRACFLNINVSLIDH